MSTYFVVVALAHLGLTIYAIADNANHTYDRWPAWWVAFSVSLMLLPFYAIGGLICLGYWFKNHVSFF